MKYLILFFLFVSFKSHALLYLNGYGSFSFGDLKEMEETVGDGTLTHDGWTMGLHAGAKVGVSISIVKAGVLGEYAKIQYEGEREDADVANAFDGAEDYDNVIDRTLVGGFVTISPPVIPVSITAEYYPSIKGKMSYAEGVGENPFGEDDEINGSGYGFGANFSTGPAQTALILRRIKYDEFVINGVTTELPSDSFTAQSAWEFVIQGGVALDLF